jgi:hypothetical protein
MSPVGQKQKQNNVAPARKNFIDKWMYESKFSFCCTKVPETGQGFSRSSPAKHDQVLAEKKIMKSEYCHTEMHFGSRVQVRVYYKLNKTIVRKNYVERPS